MARAYDDEMNLMCDSRGQFDRFARSLEDDGWVVSALYGNAGTLQFANYRAIGYQFLGNTLAFDFRRFYESFGNNVAGADRAITDIVDMAKRTGFRP